jgi:hypothetical protein
MAVPPDPFSWTQAVPWLMSAASLVWNFFNTRKTSKLQRDTKTLDRRIEEFRRIRTNLDTVLADFIQRRDALSSLVKSGGTLSALRTQVEEEQQLILDVYFKLDSALRRVDSSTFASGADWHELLNSRWDQFGDKLNGIYRPCISRADAQQAVEGAKVVLTSIIYAVESRLEQEMKSLLESGA